MEAPPVKKRVVMKKKVAVNSNINANAEVAVKKVVTKKVATKKNDIVLKSFVDHSMTSDKIYKILQKSNGSSYTIDIQPDKWVLPNRAKFITWLDKRFKTRSSETPKAVACPCDGTDGDTTGQTSCAVKVESIQLFPHQKFVKDYMQFSSPYRGLLLFHGLGVGKSLSSIAAAEILANHMDVVVMVPASLKDNYLIEIKKGGRSYFGTKQHWVFATDEIVTQDILDKLKVSREYMGRQGGIWVPVADRVPNFDSFSDGVKAVVIDQIDHMIENSYKFINYNGLQRKHIENMTQGGVNPFDNKCVIVDEIHNLISTIVNNRQIGGAIYKLLMSAKNLKIILLSGTPIINYPYEIAFLLNLITGPRLVYDLKANKESDWNTDKIDDILRNNKYVDSYEIDTNARKMTIAFLPVGFARSPDSNKVARESYVKKKDDKYSLASDDVRISMIIDEFRDAGMNISKKFSTKEVLTLPEKQEDFNSLFVDFDSVSVKNKLMFMRRILGTVSFYSTYSPELYPSKTVTEVPLTMTDTQFSLYEKARGDERKKEKASSKNKKKAAASNMFTNSGNVYRFYSRALCNFAFPEGIDRPFPSKLAMMKKEVDVEEDLEFDNLAEGFDKANVGTGDDGLAKVDFTKEYQKLLNQAVKSLEGGDYLTKEEVGKYSPKIQAIMEKMDQVNGSVMVYSQFRQVEGLGLLAASLKKNGYAEFKIKKTGDGGWDVDIAEEDYKKPKYIAFTGSNDESKILLKIFNSTFDDLPPLIKAALPKLGGSNNHRGEIIKCIMITKSGAEGISLKNVRQCHIMEPYWNQIRTDQVVGRSVRTCSHIDLPKADRHVDVFIYYMKASKNQIANSFSVRSQDKGETSDEFIYNMAKKKSKIINEFLTMMKKASVDCALNAKYHENLRCFGFPTNIQEDKLMIKWDIARELDDKQYMSEIEQHEWKGEVLRTKKGNFLLRKGTDEVYDYDLYVESGRLVKLGVLKKVGDKRVIS